MTDPSSADPSLTRGDRPNARYFRRFLAYALDYKALLALAVLMGIAKFSANFTFPWLIGTAIDDVIEPKSPRGQAMTPQQRMQWLGTLVALGVGFSVVHAISTYGRGFYASKLGNRIIADVRQDLFDHLHRLSLHFYSREKTGSIVSRLITDIQTASAVVNSGVIAVVMDMVSLVVGLVLLFGISPMLTAACMTIMPFYALTFKRLNPRVKHASLRVQSQLSKITGNVQERLAAIALVKTYATEKRESEQFQAETEEHFDRVVQQSSLSHTVQGLSELLVHLGQVIVIGLGGWLAVRGELTNGQVVKFMGYLAVMYLPVRRFADVNVVYQQSLAAIERVFQVFDVTPRIVEKSDAAKATPQLGEVAFEDVWFDYLAGHEEQLPTVEVAPGRLPLNLGELHALDKNAAAIERAERERRDDPEHRPRWTLREVSFRVEPGQLVALVGPSGSGKTTLVSLLPRLYDVTRGRILIDGLDVCDYRLRPLRRAIGIVQQDSFLFSGTIRDNIKYGRPSATDAEVLEAAKAANAHEFIATLPDGYDSIIGERGVNLSGGQKQRMSIARAVLKNPRILILDEATSALDSESEALVQEALSRLMKGRTCFVIAHRLSTIRNADRILVMRDGRVIESGRHEELLGHDGLYARLVQQQFGYVADYVASVRQKPERTKA